MHQNVLLSAFTFRSTAKYYICIRTAKSLIKESIPEMTMSQFRVDSFKFA